jgi:hypothetical protein
MPIRHHRKPHPPVTPPPPVTPVTPPPPVTPPATGKYLFQDEFTGPVGALPTMGTSPSSKLWTVRGSFTNNGAYVTDNPAVAHLDGNSNLVLAVGKAGTLGADASFFPAPIIDTGGGPASRQAPGDGSTAPKFALRPGMSCEMRIAVNTVTGTWPAAWLVPVLARGDYPANWSEIDLEESYGTGFADSSIWGTNPSKSTGDNPVNMNDVKMLPKLDNGFHVFRLDYAGSGTTVSQISMYLDNAKTPYSTLTPAQAKAKGCAWNYNTNEGMIIEFDVAVFSKTTFQPTPPAAGSTPGTILTCDYVRVWSPVGPDPYTVEPGS